MGHPPALPGILAQEGLGAVAPSFLYIVCVPGSLSPPSSVLLGNVPLILLLGQKSRVRVGWAEAEAAATTSVPVIKPVSTAGMCAGVQWACQPSPLAS